jgi:hypothetical protein
MIIIVPVSKKEKIAAATMFFILPRILHQHHVHTHLHKTQKAAMQVLVVPS